MSRNVDEIVADLSKLQPRDFNLRNGDADGIERLYMLTEELQAHINSKSIARDLFCLLERLSNSEEIDPRYDLGTPGPIVHFLEEISNYEVDLIDSLTRYPTPLTVLMVNRILNATEDNQERMDWLSRLKNCLHHPKVTSKTKGEVQGFLDFQLTGEDSV